ncbi:hypothetical protein B0H12DRAFT_241659 [Mycena haematopus]|nr:hypothetical protein B0H12DRAFT_241659 [Mycena haematopus]
MSQYAPLPMATPIYPQSSTSNAPPPMTATWTATPRREPALSSLEFTITTSGPTGPNDPAFGPDFTFADILTLRLPAVTPRNVSTSDHTAPYSNPYPSPTPPCFYLRDDELLPSLINTFHLMLNRKCQDHHRPLRNCNTPPRARVAWEFLREYVDHTPYTNQGFIATYAMHINNILSALCYYINETTCVSSASIQEFSQCVDQILLRVIRQETPDLPPINWPVSGMGVEWTTSSVFEPIGTTSATSWSLATPALKPWRVS